MNIGLKILELRKKASLSQEKLGELVGVTRQTISNWELNITLPDTKQLIELSKVFTVSIDFLVGNDINNTLEKKLDNVEEKVMLNNKISKLLFLLIALVCVFIVMFILSV